MSGRKVFPTRRKVRGEPNGAARGTGVSGRALPAADASPSAPEQQYLFDISSLPEAEEVTGAELRVLRSLPENRSLALSPEGTFHHLLLSTCPSRDGEEPRLLDSRAAGSLDLGFSKPRPQPHERALLVAFSRTQRKENLFKEIRDKIKALGSPPFLEPPDPGQEVYPKRRKRRTTIQAR
ncbi:PREDICTED: growth/differentiation factor 7-like, partial [Mesitornis unicolor]|uniref:growth/differentiation factor 7-like n=1 Tax=Mesitornis unicolor TaxID=54374 RepID=UPI00052819E8